jgi:hypothetical protein
VISRTDLADCFKSKKPAEREFYRLATELGDQAEAITIACLKKEIAIKQNQISKMEQVISELEKEISN